ncbi:Aste57867_2542 [Aphanomyces stellatus]|uniref:Aste57867_2542 protein n=1 Tax=Aphanomyces stellatus TaxID=120398 RepID=A0A485K7S4_9STRA|nr:hypothetical protein As57867_002535 [Aphanomyces stellatus]VFT79739.1 Aste57867_2542 [Aphanomyces stellatus]
MPPAAKATVPSKKTIQESFLGSYTRRAYKTYQTQFEAFLRLQKDGMDPCTAGTEECTDFFHHLYSQGKHPAKKTSKQSSMEEFVVQKAIPTARSALEAWQQLFVADPAKGLVCALKDYTKEMIRMDRKKYSERVTLALAFGKYQSYQQFEASYQGFTSSYVKLLREVRRMKYLNAL